MKKYFFSLLLIGALLLGACAGQGDPSDQTDKTENPAEAYQAITAIDHCVVEPDERDAMSDADREQYRRLMDALLNRETRVTLEIDPSRMDFLLELLHESPYCFFADEIKVAGTTVDFSFAYSSAKQKQILSFMDQELLAVANHDASPDDNELDVILKIYTAVCGRINYDTQREDNKQMGSPLFDYPGNEVYKALRDGKSLCYGFAYVLRYALLQRGVDAFCVYGECRAQEMGHEWVAFRYDGAWFHCDPAWDRAGDGDAKLMHFGTTDLEREQDTLHPRDFADYHLASYGDVKCTDERFAIFRGVMSYSWLDGHRYRLSDREENTTVFDTGEFSISEESEDE